MEEDQIREHLKQLGTYKSRGPDGIHTSAEGAIWCHSKINPGNLWKIKVIGRGSWGLEDCLQEGQEGVSEEHQDG